MNCVKCEEGRRRVVEGIFLKSPSFKEKEGGKEEEEDLSTSSFSKVLSSQENNSSEDYDMRGPTGLTATSSAIQHYPPQAAFYHPQSIPPNLSLPELQIMAQRQQQQIESQQHLLVAKEQRLKYLKQQDFKHHQMASEYDRLRRLREKVEAQELKLRKLRALRGQGEYTNNYQQHQSVTADLESIRSLFSEKEKELVLAVRKVEELTRQLDDIRRGHIGNSVNQQQYAPQLMELERLRRELAYRRQLNEQQNNMISQQRAQLSMGQEEMSKIDNRISELQERLTRKRMINQQLANQINAATAAKQAQLKSMQQQHHHQPPPPPTHHHPMNNVNNNHNSNNNNSNSNNNNGILVMKGGAGGVPPNNNGRMNKPVSTVEPFNRQQYSQPPSNEDSKYKTLPFNTKFQQNNDNATNNMNHLILPDHQGNYDNKPVGNVVPVFQNSNNNSGEYYGSSMDPYGNSSSVLPKVKPALPPKPTSNLNEGGSSEEDTSITILKGGALPNPTLSVSSHPAEEGTSVDDDDDEDDNYDRCSTTDNEDDRNGNRNHIRGNSNHNVHISINRRIEMPPAFHFPEDQTPPSDLLGADMLHHGGGQQLLYQPRDVADNASLFPMMNRIYQEFDHLSSEEKNQVLQDQSGDSDPDNSNDHPIIITTTPSLKTKKGNLKPKNAPKHNKRVSFDPLALLLDASLDGELDLVMKTAKEVEDPSAANDEGITALHNAICAGHIDIVHFLVEFGCDVNAQDSDGWTPLHCAASCNNLAMVKFLVERGACVFATTLSDKETAAEKCEEEEEGFHGCSEYLYSIQDKLGSSNGGVVYAVFDYVASQSDELNFKLNEKINVQKKIDENEMEWWWCQNQEKQLGYVPRNYLGFYPRVKPQFKSKKEASSNEEKQSSSIDNNKISSPLGRPEE
ncbi:apoptosis-stimulating of p53 protein 1 isoform X2 [Lepeophtheirus salmonis]|nr:apoptosis-stimulating of p53 protein 1-like isoform X2 [Lepeophtheirus salmonis]